MTEPLIDFLRNLSTRSIQSWFRSSLFLFICIALFPFVVLIIFSLIDYTKLLSIIVAFYLYSIPAIIVGSPYFEGEFLFPQNNVAYCIVLFFWISISFLIITIYRFLKFIMSVPKEAR